MSEVTTSRRINLSQLAVELGGAILTARTQDGVTVVNGTIPQGTLEAAVAAHNAPDPAVLEANETAIRDRADVALSTNTAFLNLTNPTNAQNAAQVKALTRQANGLIRLALRRFDSAD